MMTPDAGRGRDQTHIDLHAASGSDGWERDYRTVAGEEVPMM
jgi:hypothetical protein